MMFLLTYLSFILTVLCSAEDFSGSGSDFRSCVDAGFEDCCIPNSNVNCYAGFSKNCFCDQMCYQFNDCCFDITEICPFPLPLVTIFPGSVKVSYNSTVILICKVQSLTTPNVTWTSNTGVTLPSTSRFSNEDIHIHNIRLEQVTLEYIGEYTCTAENEGGVISDMINVHVFVPLPVVIIFPDPLYVSYSSTVNLICVVLSLTTPNVTWTTDTNVILPSTLLVSNDDIHISTLTLQQVTLEYIGEYTCTAENEAGEIGDITNFDVYDLVLYSAEDFSGSGSVLNSCVDAGFEDCCTSNVSCSVQSVGFSSCFCDRICYQFNDCCFDIAEICPFLLPVVIIFPDPVYVLYSSTAYLICVVLSPTTPNITWTTDTNVILPSTLLVSNNDTYISILTFQQVTLEYIGDYTCTAENEAGEISDVYVSFPVPQLVAITSPLLVRYGSTATLKCRVQSLTIPTVKWTSNTNVILPSTSLVSSNDDIHTSTLKFKQVTLEYIGEYTCTAEHRGGEISVTFRLDVFVPPPAVTISPGSVNVSYSSTVILTCVVQSLTTPNVTWTTETNVILPSTSRFSNNDNNIYNSTLILEQVTLEYIGEYTCTAENRRGEISNIANVDVFVPFPVVTISPGSVNVSYSSTVTLTCEVQSLTTPTVTWTSNTDVILPSTSLVSNDDIYYSTLTLEQVTLLYIGEYTCTAKNEGGEISDMINVDVFVLCSAEDFSGCGSALSYSLLISIIATGSQEIGSTYTLQCKVTSVNIPTIIWKNSTDIISNSSAGIEVGSLVNNGDIWSVTLTLGPLHQSHDGEYMCIASDTSNQTVTVDVIIPQPQVNIDPESSISVAVGQPLTLECQVSLSDSLNGAVSSITWEYRNSTISQEVSEGMYSLDLGTVVSAEAGIYTCSVQVTSPYVDIDPYLSANSTVTVFVRLIISSGVVINTYPLVHQYFSGIGITFHRIIIFVISDELNPKVVTTVWRKGGDVLTGDSRLTVTQQSLDFEYLTQLDSDNYTCEVFFTSNVNSEFITDSSVSSSIMINVEGPTPDIILTSSTLHLPTHPDYNQVTLNCTATLPLPPETNELEFDKLFTWTMNGTDVTSDASTPTDPRGIESVSTLTRELTIAGNIVFRCKVNISIPGDPVVSNSNSVTITVLGPSNPVQPTNLTVVNINYTVVTIQWTVSSIVYTPEQFIVLYGLTESSLTQESDMVNGTMESNNIGKRYSVELTGLTQNTVYYYQVRSTNTEGSTNSDTKMFITERIFEISHGPSDANITYGESVSFTCTVFIETPVDINIFWETTALNSLPDATTIMTSINTCTSTLTINSVDLMSNGEYTCVAMNDVGVAMFPATLSVVVPLPLVTISPESVNVSYKSTVTLTCEVQSLTTPTVTWTSNNEVTLPSSTSLFSSNDNDVHNSALTLEQVTMEYSGEYTCTAENEGGEMSDVINVHVFGADEQSSTRTIIITTVTVIIIILLFVVIILLITLKCWRNRVKSRHVEMNSSNQNDHLQMIEINEEREKYIQRFLQNSIGTVCFGDLSSNLISASRIRLLEKIGQGEFGIVYRGLLTHESDLNSMPQAVAVKTLKGAFTKSDMDSILLESVKMKYFDHLNVLPLIGVCLDLGDAPYILTPFMDEGSLLSYLKRERPNLTVSENAEEDMILDTSKQLLSMGLQIANGMMYLAQRQIVHRDLATRNCMISSSGIIKVADFGLSEDIYCTHYYRQTSSVKLPIKWMSLESINDGFFNEKTDVWSYGVVCWEIFSLGIMPYPTLSPKEVVELLSTGERLNKPSNSACSQEIYSIMTSCWYQNPDERPCFSEVVEMLNHILVPLAEYMDFTEFYVKNVNV